jgi:two-component system, cell cycle response regulator DivK
MTRLLLVEDHEEIWDFLSRRLKRRGYEVVLATDGRQAVDRARADHPDIILLDMNLPVLDGWTAAGLIKSSVEAAGVPIIALTAHAMSGDREKTIAAGCDDYHPKPIDFPRLIKQIEDLLSDRSGQPRR